MVFIKFEGFILALLIVSFAVQSLSVHVVHHQERRLLEGKSITETQENDAYLKKELVAGALGIGSGSNELRIGGRKMGMKLNKEDGEMASSSSTGDAQKLNMEAEKNASKEGPQDFLNNQGQENMLQKLTIDPAKRKPPINNHERSDEHRGFFPSVATPSHYKPNKISSDEHQNDDEWRKLLEEADKKVMQMLRRDYSGMRRPRRKPPINNHEPGN